MLLKKRQAPIMIWIARILSVMVIGFLLFFLFGEGLESISVLHIFFPFGVMLGLILAWLFEGIGATVTIMSIVAFYILHYLQHGKLPSGPFFLISSIPSVLFLVSMLMRRRMTKDNAAQPTRAVDGEDA